MLHKIGINVRTNTFKWGCNFVGYCLLSLLKIKRCKIPKRHFHLSGMPVGERAFAAPVFQWRIPNRKSSGVGRQFGNRLKMQYLAAMRARVAGNKGASFVSHQFANTKVNSNSRT